MDSHEKFKLSLLGAPQDVSLQTFEELQGQGYDKVDWHTSPSAKDAPCLVVGGESWPMDEFLMGPGGGGLQHAAPMYERTHVGCNCTVVVSGPGLSDVVVNAFGKV